MCGRYTDTKRDKQFLVRMGVEQAEIDFVPRYNVAPTQFASVVSLNDDGRAELRRARWGLIPFWAKDEKIANRLVNARAEGLASKPAFRTAFKKRRCLVLADGFFEWQKVPGGKRPMYIYLNGGQPFVFGGLWDRWKDVETFTIITVPPNELVSRIHDRMPLILPDEDIPRWLDPTTPEDALSALLRPHSAAKMDCCPVSFAVNTPKVDSPECIRRVDPALLLKAERGLRRKFLVRDNEPMLPGLE